MAAQTFYDIGQGALSRLLVSSIFVFIPQYICSLPRAHTHTHKDEWLLYVHVFVFLGRKVTFQGMLLTPRER